MGPLFTYFARDEEGKGKDGTIEAINKDAAIRKLQAQRLFVINVEQQKEKRIINRRVKQRRTRIRRIREKLIRKGIKKRVARDRVTKDRRIKDRRLK